MLHFANPFRQLQGVRELDDLRREVDRAFSQFRPAAAAAAAANVFLPGRGPRHYPLVNLAEDAEAIHLEALAPGIDPESIQISVLRNQLTISGEKPAPVEGAKAEDFHRNERAGGKFVRTITLPSEVDDSRVTAEYVAGILRIHLPKAEAAKPRRVQVNIG